jgi:S1-C subfamily serine protease
MRAPRRTIAAALAAAALAATGCGGNGGGLDGPGTPSSAGGGGDVERTTTRVKVVEGITGGFDPRAIYEEESPGVVTIISVFDSGSSLDAILGGGGGGGGGLGSGFVLNGRGEIVTNAHVVTNGSGEQYKEADQVYVAFADGNRVEADVLGTDPNADVALLKIDPEGLDLNPLPLGSTRDLQVGSPVAAMGSPFGEEQSLSVGVVSAVDRDVESLNRNFQISGAIQTDAAINPGNSGGPLVDARGRVIGLNQQIQTQSGGNEGVGFAVPIDLAKRSIDQLREGGRTDYAYLGVSTQEVYPQLAERFDLPAERGALVQEATAGGPAAAAGLEGGTDTETFQANRVRTGGDLIVSVAGRAVKDPSDVAAAIAQRDPGDKVDVVVYRDGERRTVQVELGRRPVDVTGGSGG